MRLPQSKGRSLSVPDVCRTAPIAVAVAAVLLLSAQASAQQLLLSPIRLMFGTVVLGTSETEVVVVRNGGSTSTTVSTISVSGSDFKVHGPSLPVVLAAGGRLALEVRFAPTTTGFEHEEITITEESSNQTRLGVAGLGVKSESLNAVPSSLSFGQVAVGTKAELSVVLTNKHSWIETVKNAYTMSPGFYAQGPKPPFTVAPGKSVTFRVTFAPRSAGLQGAGLFIAGPAVDIPIIGIGTTPTVATLSVAPSTLSFGSVDVGSSSKQSLILGAPSGGITVFSAASSNSQFTIAGATFPLTISAGKSTNVDVVFSPTTSGASSGKLTFASNASDSQVSEPLTGIGVVAQYSVQLSWNASTSSVAGYNVYRGTVAGRYSKINTALDPNTAYTDSTAVSGTTYYYAATAVSSSGQESSYSAPLKVVIP